MNDAAIPEKDNDPAWRKRRQMGTAVLGAVMATTSYFGKDHLQARWSDHASSIKIAQANDDAVDNTASLYQRLDGLRDDLRILTEDALALEQHQAPHAQSDRFDSTRVASLNGRNDWVSTILRKCQQRLRSLSALDKVTDPGSRNREELTRMLQDVDIKLANTEKASVAYLIPLHPEVFLSSSPTSSSRVQGTQNEQMDELEKETDHIEARTAELAVIVRNDAEQQREKYTRYEERTTVILSVVFVFGLLLSLLGKLGSEEA